MDKNGYATKQELEYIKSFDVTKNDWEELMRYIQENCWYWGATYFNYLGNTWTAITGGWSGNEDVICALKENIMFWMLYWKESHRGGLYKFQDAYRLLGDTEPPKEDG